MTCHVINVCHQMAPSFAPASGVGTSDLRDGVKSVPSEAQRRWQAEAGGLLLHTRLALQTLLPTKWSPPACKRGGKQATKC